MNDAPREVAVVATSQTSSYRRFDDSEPKLIMRCVNDLLRQTGLDRSSRTGSTTVNVVSSPGMLATSIRPPWAVTIAFTRVRPRPIPSDRLPETR